VTSDHGTHVAGIAAGRRVRGTPYVGFAPNADLVFAAFGNSGDEADDINAWFSSSLCDAVRFIFDEAERRGQPAVVNLSLGSHAGPHDGSSLEDRCLDELVGPGRIIVASAGNEGEGSYHSTRDEQVVVHASGELGVAPKRAWFLVPGAEDGGLLEGQLWVNPGAELTARLGVRSAAGVDVTTESVALDGQLDGVTLDVDGAPLGPIALYGDETPSGARALEFAVLDEDGDGAEADLDWFIEVSGAGAMDGFIDTTFGGGFVERAEGFAADSSMTVGFPAVIPNVIAVGAYVTRPTWRAEDGSWYASLDSQTEEPVTLGELCKFSSRGPSRDPARTGLKPDVVAPGEMIVSALARTGGAADPQVLIDSSRNGFIVEAGTSQSSPAIAGIIALQLERDPSLTPEKLRAIWKDAAQVPKGGSAEDWGRGKLDAWRAVSLTPEVNAGHKPKKSDSGCSVAGPQGRNFGWVGVGAAVTGGLLRRRRRPASGLRRAAS
jgi:subtilisin family serine protease